ncbi:MAG: rhodanese-like domain-containing protein [Candidatus Zixiibacteriota bacterium]
MKRLVGQAVLLTILALVFGLGRNMVGSNTIPWVGDWAERDSVLAEIAKNPEALPASAQDGDPPFLTLAQAMERHSQPDVVFLDAREPQDFEAGHIEGSLLLPFDYFDDYWPAVQEKLTPETRIVTYCSGAECELSLFLARHLRSIGYPNVEIFFGGWTIWQEGGQPIESGPPTS